MDTKYLLFMFQHWQTIQNIKKYRMQTVLTPRGKSAPAKGRWGKKWLRVRKKRVKQLWVIITVSL